MKKFTIKFIISFFFLILSVISACQKDDICTAGTTPDLQIKFFAYNDTVEKPVDTLYVIVLPLQDTIINGSNDMTNLSLALNVNADTTNFVLSSVHNNDTITFRYIRERIFVSKACGYKINFHDLNVDLQQDNDNWIKQIDILNHDIITDTVVHVKIYH